MSTCISELSKSYARVSSRNFGVPDPLGKGDSISIFKYINGELKLINHIFPGLEQICGIEFGTACQGAEDYLIAAESIGEIGVVVLKRTDKRKSLTEVARNTELLTRNTFLRMCRDTTEPHMRERGDGVCKRRSSWNCHILGGLPRLLMN
jgi:hypothetical protein